MLGGDVGVCVWEMEIIRPPDWRIKIVKMMAENVLLEFDVVEPDRQASDVRSGGALFSKDVIYLIGGYRKDSKDQLSWILGTRADRKDDLYNVRLDRGRDGWVYPENPKVANPTFVILYEIGNERSGQLFFRVISSCRMSETEMLEAGYPNPKGAYLVYRLSPARAGQPLDILKVLTFFRERRNYVEGKPIFVSGAELRSILRKTIPVKPKDTPIPFLREAGENGLPTRDQVCARINPFADFVDSGLTSIDLFSGCGGLTKGFEMAGIRSILASDIDENCEKTFRRNFPGVPFLCKDVTEISKEEVDALIGKQLPDIIIGGPPCQGFSLANKRRNKIADDPRNRLFYGFVKFINWYSPKVFVMENVKGLLSMKNGEVIKTMVEEFTKAGEYGYNVTYKMLLASDFGVPQNRERIIMIGTRKDLSIQPVYPVPLAEGRRISVDEAISDLPQIAAGEGNEVEEYLVPPQNDYQRLMRSRSEYVLNHIAMRHTPRLVARFKAIRPGQSLVDVWDTHGSVKRGAPKEKSIVKFSQNNQRLYGDQPAPTIAASFQSNFIHPHLDRNFTAREGARLQSFPDDFIFEGMRTKMSWEKGLSQYQQIGNAVPVLMAKAIADCIVEQLQPDNDESV